MLEVRGIHSYYGQAHILADVSLTLAKGEIVVLVGRNGAGKSTTIKSIMGMVRVGEGSIAYDGAEILGDAVRLRAGGAPHLHASHGAGEPRLRPPAGPGGHATLESAEATITANGPPVLCHNWLFH